MMRGKWVKINNTTPDNGCRWYLEFSVGARTSSTRSSLASHSHLPICRRGELSHHFCWVGSPFKVSIGHVSEESFCCQSSTFQNIWALPNECIVPSLPFPFSPVSFFSFPGAAEEGGVLLRTVWVMREISGRDALESGDSALAEQCVHVRECVWVCVGEMERGRGGGEGKRKT